MKANPKSTTVFKQRNVADAPERMLSTVRNTIKQAYASREPKRARRCSTIGPEAWSATIRDAA